MRRRELEEDWLARVPRLLALLSLKWGPGGGVGSGGGVLAELSSGSPSKAEP